jgi:hypothetical protein
VRKFFNGLFAFILIAIIIGGLGYIGYSYYFVSSGSLTADMYSDNAMNMDNNSANGADAMQGMQGMEQGSMTMQDSQGNMMIVDTVKDILSNKESLDNIIAAFDDSLSSLTLDPYSPSEGLNSISTGTSPTGSMSGMQMPDTTMPNMTMPADTAIPTDAAANIVNGNTTTNVYTENNNATKAQGTSVLNMSMKDMGTSYDASKMEQLHAGLYKLAVGMQLLEQLNSEIIIQAEAVRTANTQNPVEYYSDQYTQILQNKNKLNKAINSINEAKNMVNINPYVSDNGFVYDKNRMMNIHESIFMMAKGVVLIDQLNDELVKQAIDTSVDAQNALSNLNMNAMVNQNNTVPTNGIFGSMNLPSILNMILIAFVVLFVFGLLGAISSLFKTPKQNVKQ